MAGLTLNDRLDSVETKAAQEGTVTEVTVTAPLAVATGTTTPALSIDAASTTVPGYMSAADKTKLDGIATGATAPAAVTTSVNGLMIAADKVKLDAISGVPSYGGCYEFNETGSAITLSANNTWYRWITGAAGSVKGTGYITWDDTAAPTGKRLVVGGPGAGLYLVTCAYSAVSNIATDIDAAIYINATRQENCRVDQAFPASALYQSATITGLITLAADNTVSLWFNASQNTATLTVRHVNLTLVRVA